MSTLPWHNSWLVAPFTVPLLPVTGLTTTSIRHQTQAPHSSSFVRYAHTNCLHHFLPLPQRQAATTSHKHQQTSKVYALCSLVHLNPQGCLVHGLNSLARRVSSGQTAVRPQAGTATLSIDTSKTIDWLMTIQHTCTMQWSYLHNPPQAQAWHYLQATSAAFNIPLTTHSDCASNATLH